MPTLLLISTSFINFLSLNRRILRSFLRESARPESLPDGHPLAKEISEHSY